MAFCGNCGHFIGSVKFCPNCGKPVSSIHNHYRGQNVNNSSNKIYYCVGIGALIILVLLGIAGLSFDAENSEKKVENITSIKSIEDMQNAIQNTTWTHTEKGDIWYKFVFKESTMIHYAAFPSDGHWRYLGEVEYSIVENRSSYDGQRYIAAVFDIAKYNIPVEFNFSDCHLYSFGFDIGRCKLGDFEWD